MTSSLNSPPTRRHGPPGPYLISRTAFLAPAQVIRQKAIRAHQPPASLQEIIPLELRWEALPPRLPSRSPASLPASPIDSERSWKVASHSRAPRTLPFRIPSPAAPLSATRSIARPPQQ